MTGSLRAALLAGMRPPSIVMPTLMATSTPAAGSGSTARTVWPSSSFAMTALMGKVSSMEMPTPRSPAQRPTSSVSALKTCETLRFDAPRARRMPISFVRSSTEMCVMMPIMMQETTSDTATNAMST
jgi:hypothetical protein